MMVTIYPNYGQDNLGILYDEINQQMSLISGKRMQCLLEEVPKYHNGYHIPMQIMGIP